MKKMWKRAAAALVSAALCCALAGPVPARAEEDSAQLLGGVSTGTYTCANAKIQQGKRYTLIVLKRGLVQREEVLTAAMLLTMDPLYVGSALAEAPGFVTFENVRLRTADAVDYFITGPGFAVPYRESSGEGSDIMGYVRTTVSADRSATVTLEDSETGYRYTNAAAAGATGEFSFGGVAPGTYIIWVKKPGYLPVNGGEVAVTSSYYPAEQYINIAPYVGDVNNDGVRSNADMADLLLYYGDSSGWPEDLTPDLTTDGTVDSADLGLLSGKAGFTVGSANPAADPLLTVTDSQVSGSLRKLSFVLTGSTTFSAGAFTLSYHRDTVQPCNTGGGAFIPTHGATRASCLTVPNGAVTLNSTSWAVEEGYTSLTFSLTASALSAAEGLTLAEFYYQPKSGSTDTLFSGAFRLPRSLALVGKDRLVDSAALTYPNSTALNLRSLKIDQADGQTLEILGNGQTNILLLTASGEDAAGTLHENVPGVTWTVRDQYGQEPIGVTISGGLLSVESNAPAGMLTVTASRDGHSDRITVELVAVPSVPARLALRRLEAGMAVPTPLTQLELTMTTDRDAPLTEELTAANGYSAALFDQYGVEMAPPALSDLTWTLSGAPSGVTLENCRLTVPAELRAGSYRFSFQGMWRDPVSGAEVQTGADVVLTVEAVLGTLSISGADSANIPVGAGVLTVLNYIVAGRDTNGDPMPAGTLFPDVSIVPQGDVTDPYAESPSAAYDMKGCQVTVSSAAKPGHYTLTASQGGVTVDFTLELLRSPVSMASYLAVYLEGAPVNTASFTAPAGSTFTAAFSAKLMDATGVPLESQPASFTWELSAAPAGAAVSAVGVLTVPVGEEARTCPFTLTVSDPGTGFSATLPIALTVTPVLGTLEIGPGDRTLTIPSGEQDTSFTFSLVSAKDTQGRAMQPPEDLTWSVARAAAGGGLTGIAMDSRTGTLTVGRAASPGTLTVTAASPGKNVTSNALTVTLPPKDCSLQLYREGQPVTGRDVVNVKEGSGPVAMVYTAKVLDKDGAEVEGQTVSWLNGGNSLVLAAGAERGTYTATIMAIYQNIGASVEAQINVYPDIVDLETDWGSQTLRVPEKGSTAVYEGTVTAVTRRGERIPLSELNDIALTVTTPLNGVLCRYDTASRKLVLTVESAVAAELGDSGVSKTLSLSLAYFPGEEPLGPVETALTLDMAEAEAVSAALLRAVPSGGSLIFSMAERDTVTVAAGQSSNCYALRIQDQYGGAMSGAEVEWALTDAPRGVVLVPYAGAASYPSYADICQLQVGDETEQGVYLVTVTAAAEGFTCELQVTLTVVDPTSIQTMEITGRNAVSIPVWYTGYNDPGTVNSSTEMAVYTLSLRNALGEDVTPAGIRWSLTDGGGEPVSPAGVTLTKDTEDSAILEVTREAQPTGGSPLYITATHTASGKAAAWAVALVRDRAVPTALLILNSQGEAVSSDQVTVVTGETESRSYTPCLVDQYNQPMDPAEHPVSWREGELPAGVAFDRAAGTLTVTDQAADGSSFAITATREPPPGETQPLTGSVAVTVVRVVVSYTVEYYQEKADGSGYEVFETEIIERAAGSSVSAPVKSYDHFTENTALGTLTGTVTADNALVLSRYYDRVSYTVSFVCSGGSALPDVQVKYGAEVPRPADPIRIGFELEGWYTDPELTQPYTFGPMPGEDLALYAGWAPVGLAPGMDYVIYGISLTDSGGAPLSAIPAGRFRAQITVTNFYAARTDALILAAYDSGGRMVNLWFYPITVGMGESYTTPAVSLNNTAGTIVKLKAFIIRAPGDLVPVAEAKEV